jgi:hypothetical protein
MTRGNRFEEILLVEDKGNPLELSINTLRKNGCSNMCITQETKELLGREIHGNAPGKNADILDRSYMLIYTKPNNNGSSKALRINSKLKVIPLLLLVGPRKEIDLITDSLHGVYSCFKQSVNLRGFIKKMRKRPMYWASIDTMLENTR